MVIPTSDGKGWVRITWAGAQRKMARAAMAKGDMARAYIHYELLRKWKMRRRLSAMVRRAMEENSI